MRANPVATGAFKFTSFQTDVSLRLAKNNDYWIKGKPYLDGIEFILAADPVTKKLVLKSGEGDALGGLPPKDAQEFADTGFKIINMSPIVGLLVPDTANADSPWANSKVREAVEYAIDREAIAKAFGYGYMQPYYQIPPSGTLSHDPNFPLARKYNLEKAKQLLTEAGFSNGFETTIITIPIINRDIAQTLQGYLAKVSIKVNLDFPEMGKFLTYNGPGTWRNAALFTAVPVTDLYFISSCEWLLGTLGQSWVRPPEFVQALDAATNSPSQDVKLVRAVTDMIINEALLIPVNENPMLEAQRLYIMDLGNSERGVLNLIPHYEDVWLNR